MIYIDFLLTSLVVVLMPGSGVLYTAATGLFNGKRASVFAAIGCTFGITPALFARFSRAGGDLSQQRAGVSDRQVRRRRIPGLPRVVDVAQFITTGVAAGTTQGRVHGDSGQRVPDQHPQPKAVHFFLAFLPQFVSPEGKPPNSPIRRCGT